MSSRSRDVYLAGAVRSPMGKFGGVLSTLTAPDLGVHVARAAIERAGFTPPDIEETIMGLARPAGVGPNPARQFAYRAGIPETAPAYTVNKACGSSLRAIVNACQSILCGDNDIVLAGGAEAMSRAPFLLDGVRWGNRLGHQQVIDSMYRDGFFCPLCGKVMGETAETLAGRYGITRREQDAYAAESQQRCERARRAGHFKNELVPMNVKTPRGDIQVDRDEHPRDGVTPESLAKLPAVFKEGGTVHAGSSSGIVDGAAALIVLSNKAVEEHKARPMAITPL